MQKVTANWPLYQQKLFTSSNVFHNITWVNFSSQANAHQILIIDVIDE